jgi:uncharacterized membrane protein
MIGLAIGAGALLGYAFYRRARWHHAQAFGYGHGCGHHHHGFHGGWDNPWGGNPWGGHPSAWGGPPWARMRRRMRFFYGAMAALDLSPAQEKLVRTELEALKEKARQLRPELHQTRSDLARAVGGPVLDRAALDGVFTRHDQALGELRAALTGALERIHAALDDRQRERLAAMIDRRGWRNHDSGARPDAGPYRV